MNRQDMLIKSDNRGIYDIQIDGSDFASAKGFESAIPTSFFSDSRAPAVQVQEAQSRRGWVGNILTAVQSRELGGLLWILDQARITNDTLNFAKSFAQDSLQWLIDDNIVRSIQVLVIRNGVRGITILTDITTIENTVLRYVTLWRDTNLTRILP
jgi:phage gp46-like protein